MKAILVFVVVLGMATIGWGQSYYKYVDKNGTVCFTEDPNDVNLRGVVQDDGMKVLKDTTRKGGITDYRIQVIGEANQAEADRQKRISAYEQKKLDYQKAVEQRILAERRRIALEKERQAQAEAEALAQIEQYNKKTYGLTPPPSHHQDDAPSVPAFHGKGTTYSTFGNTTFGSDGSTSFQFGNQTINSDSTITNQFGNTFYKSNGATSNRSGNMMYDSDGTICTKFGNQTFCH